MGLHWFHHPDHGYMLRIPIDHHHAIVVTAFALDTADIQDNEELWLLMKRGRGSHVLHDLCISDILDEEEHNPEYKPVESECVPPWIKKDFVDRIN